MCARARARACVRACVCVCVCAISSAATLIYIYYNKFLSNDYDETGRNDKGLAHTN